MVGSQTQQILLLLRHNGDPGEGRPQLLDPELSTLLAHDHVINKRRARQVPPNISRHPINNQVKPHYKEKGRFYVIHIVKLPFSGDDKSNPVIAI